MTSVAAPLTVAVTGHRWNGLEASDPPALAARVDEVLLALQKITTSAELRRAGAFEPDQLVVVSALAEGVDRIVADRALALGLTLRALLPLPRAVYDQDFPSDASKEEFADLLDRAHEVRELAGADGERSAAYETLGLRLLGSADVLLAVWDGEPSRGEGGTGAVIAHALRRELPVLWIDARRPHQLTLYANGIATAVSLEQDSLATEIAALLGS